MTRVQLLKTILQIGLQHYTECASKWGSDVFVSSMNDDIIPALRLSEELKKLVKQEELGYEIEESNLEPIIDWILHYEAKEVE